jgi:hypothetical protein
MAHYHQACIQCTSTQLSDIEHAQKAFGRLIPYFEKKVWSAIVFAPMAIIFLVSEVSCLIIQGVR